MKTQGQLKKEMSAKYFPVDEREYKLGYASGMMNMDSYGYAAGRYVKGQSDSWERGYWDARRNFAGW